MKVLLLSDIHLCHIPWYGMSPEARMEKLVRDLCDEYEREPYEAVLMLGDYSLDYWEVGPLYGSYSNGGVSNTARFLRDYVKRFPCPAYFIPGNHEQYTYEDWERITGAKRSFVVTIGDAVFVMLDNFGENLNAPVHNHGTYSFSDTGLIRNAIKQNPGKMVFLCAHDFALGSERDEFKTLVREEDAIIAMFAGHTHKSEIIWTNDEYGSKPLCRAGNYSYSSMPNPEDSMWGWREIKIDGDKVTTAYVVPESMVNFGAGEVKIDSHRQDAAELT